MSEDFVAPQVESSAQSDLKNLLRATPVEALILGDDMAVRLITPALAARFGLTDADIGRDINDLAAQLNASDLAQVAFDVARDVPGIERVWSAHDHALTARLRPYLNAGGQAEGCVITFVPRAPQDLAQEQQTRDLRAQVTELEAMFECTPIGLSLVDRDLRILRINEELAAINGFSVTDHIGKRQEDLIPDIDHRIKDAQQEVFRTGQPMRGLSVRGETPRNPGHIREWLVDYYPLKYGETVIALGTCVQEVTQQRAMERATERFADAISEREARIKRMFDVVPALIVMHDGPEHTFAYLNPAGHARLGGEDLIGKPLTTAFPHVVATDHLAAFDECYTTAAPVTRPEVRYDAPGPNDTVETYYYSHFLQPYFDDTGAIQGVMSFAYDITEQVMAREEVAAGIKRLQASEARMERLFDQAPAVISIFEGADNRYLYVNPAHDRAIGRRDVIGKPLRDAMPELEGQGIYERFEHVFATGEPDMSGELAAELIGPDGRARTAYFQQIIQPWFREDGSVGGTMSFNSDVTELVEAREEVRRSEDRLRKIQDSLMSFVGLLTPEGTMKEVNELALVSAGLSRDDVIGKPFWECFWWSHDPALQADLEGWVRDAAQGKRIRSECQIKLAHDQIITIDFQMVPSFDDDGRVTELVPSGIDITDWKAAEARKDTLLAELQHRVKNVLATVQAVTRFTARHADTQEALVEGLQSRLIAMSRTHDALTRSDWAGHSLHAMITDEVSPYTGAGEEHLEIIGDDVLLEPSDALSLALALHELATNAAKYGALSTEAGRVTVTADVRDATLLGLHWCESGGPTVETSTRSGFGSFLIERVLSQDLEADVDLSYPASGVECRITFHTGHGVSGDERV